MALVMLFDESASYSATLLSIEYRKESSFTRHQFSNTFFPTIAIGDPANELRADVMRIPMKSSKG